MYQPQNLEIFTSIYLMSRNASKHHLYKLVCPCSAVCAVSMSVLQCGPRGFALVGMHVPVKFLLITISVYKVALQSRYVYNEQFVLNAALFFAPGP